MASPVLKNATDSYVSEKYPTKNYSNVNRIFLADNSAADTRYGYLYFGVPSGMAKTTIISAKVKLYSGAGFSGSVTLSLHRLAAKFTGTKVNWNNKPATTGGSISVTKTGSTLNRMWEFDVTALMQAIANGAPWYGFRISATNSTAKWIHSAQAISAYRPTLEIVWSDAPDTPKVLIPDNDEIVSVAKPTLQWDFTDPSGDTTMQALNVRLYSTEALATVGAVGDLADVTMASNIPQLDLDDVGLGAPSDVMVNGSVDANANGYQAFSNCAVVRDTVTMRTGAGSLKITATAGGSTLALGAYTVGNRIPCLPGQTVTFKSYVRSAVTPRAHSVVAYFYDAAMTLLGTYYVGTAVASTTSGWTQAIASGVAPAGTAYTAPGYYTPVAAASEVHFWDDTTCEKTWDGVGLDGFLWWRVRVQDGAGLWSGWSPVGSFQRKSKGTVTITNPPVAPNDFVTNPTPPFSWTFDGRTQKAYEVLLSTPEQPGVYIWRSGITTSVDTAVTPPPGKITENGKTYRLTIRIYDTEGRRALPDDTVYAEATRDFTYNLSNTVATVTGLVGTSDPYRSKMTLNFDRSTAPDFFIIYRDGKVIAEVEPSDILVSGTSYSYKDIDAKPRKSHTWIVAAKVNGVVSSGNPTVTGKVKAITTTLSMPDGSMTAFLLNPEVAAERAEDSEIHYILGDAPPVLVTQAQRGYEGSISGVLADSTVPGETAEGMLAYMEFFKDNPGLVTRLVWVDKIMSVVIRRVSDVPIPYPDGTVDYLVSFEFFQVDF